MSEEQLGPDEGVEIDTTDATEAEDACPAFGKAWDPKVDTCQACEGVYPNEHDECKKLTLRRKAKRSVVPQKVQPESGAASVQVDEDGKSEAETLVEQQDAGTPELKPKKERIERPGGKTIKQLCKDLIAEGKTEEEVKKLLAQEYMNQGKDEKYAMGRAKAVFGDVLKHLPG